MNVAPILCVGLLTLLERDPGLAQSTLTFRSDEKQTTLLELYTSEGCSSCPSAESWLGRLKTDQTLWKAVVPVAFHVDYWDYLGWRDPWAAKSFSERQRSYAAAWSAASVYTPGFVLNGKEWRAWSSQKAPPQSHNESVGVLKVSSTDTEHWLVSFAPAASRP